MPEKFENPFREDNRDPREKAESPAPRLGWNSYAGKSPEHLQRPSIPRVHPSLFEKHRFRRGLPPLIRGGDEPRMQGDLRFRASECYDSAMMTSGKHRGWALSFVAVTVVLGCGDETKTDEDCQNAVACYDFGKCTASDDQCVAQSNVECRQSRVCKYSGRCTAKGGQCVINSDADCRQSSACQSVGTCTFKDGACIVGWDIDCRQSFLCADWGKCTHKAGECIIGSAADCKSSKLCSVYKYCSYKDGKCCNPEGKCAS